MKELSEVSSKELVPGQESQTRPRSRRRKLVTKEGFYASALKEAEKLRLPAARSIEGLDEEIALLRVRLRTLVEENPENVELLLKGMAMLIRAVSSQYRLSNKAEDDLYQNMLGVLRGIGGALYPEVFSEVG